MTHLEIRQKFLDFFKEKGHTIVPSSSLLPGDPSVLFTTAGMQQFKSYYTGEADPNKDFGSLNTVSIQKSMRTSDINEVGDDSHLTFFEMLGNFSFGGYFKEEAIKWAYDFITKEMKLSIDYVSIFGGEGEIPPDNESAKVWQAVDYNIPVKKFGMADNFWGPTGNEGPCGPTTEIYINGVEIWNIVFNQYYLDKDKKYRPLKTPGVDTGMGLERLLAAVQKKAGVFETDILSPLIGEIESLGSDHSEANKASGRIVVDHFRAAIFLIVDGVRPLNIEQGYVLRRLIRRAIRHSQLLNLPPDIHEKIFNLMAKQIYAEVYPALEQKRNETLNTIWTEWQKFNKALAKGLKMFEKVAEILKKTGQKIVPGKDTFDLYTSYGFPLELVQELAKEKEMTVDVAGFQKEIEIHKAKSRQGSEKKFGGHGLILNTGELKAANEEEVKIVTRLHTATHLLHAALRKILGEEVHQAGSDITAERLRFDFTFPRKLTPEEIKKVEDLVNEIIVEDLKVTKREMAYQDAIKTGALSFFKLKYPPVVDVYSVGDFSKELCGGPHVNHTAEIGRFKIIKEEAISAGIRRIRAVVGS